MKDLTPHKSYIKMIKREEFARFLKGEDIWPWQIEISLTDECNLKCKWCVSGELTHASRMKRKTIETDILLDFLEEFKDKNGKAVTFTGGGEPTQHPDIARIIKQTHLMGLQVGLFTNGVYPYELNQALKYCLWIRFSVDFGISGHHKKNLTREMFDLMCWNMERIMIEPPTLGMNVNVGPLHDQQDINELIQMSRIAEYLQFRVLLPTKYSEDFKLAPVWEYIKQLRGEGKLNPPRFRFSDDRLTEMENNRFYNWETCLGHHFVPFLHADGNLQTCAYHPNNPKTHFGNIYESTWEEIWKGDQRKKAIKYVAGMDYKAMCQPCCKLTAWNELIDSAIREQQHEYFT